ncbi:hypothetical protein FJZ26_03695 [Candidatus Parvarchaeota archaeon]|nr:hypothetical protein [Candidatus Parvarchaeota archaeon]
MRQMASLEYMFLVRELEGLAGERLEKFVHFGGKSFRLKIGGTDIAIDAPARANMTKYIADSPKTPTDFCLQVRSRIEGALLKGVRQHEADRVIYFELEKAGEKFTLVFEMFSGGNCILVGGEGKILNVLVQEEWKDRALKPKQDYKFPQTAIPKSGMLDAKSIVSGKYISSCLSRLPIGTMYTNEALARCAIDQKTPASSLAGSEIARLEGVLHQIAGTCASTVYFDSGGKAIEFSTTGLALKASATKAYGSLSEAADEYYLQNPLASISEEQKAQTERLEKLIAMEKSQLEAIGRLEAQAAQLSVAGRKILENLGLVEQCIEFAAKNDEAGAQAKKFCTALCKSGKLSVDRKKGRLEIELD